MTSDQGFSVFLFLLSTLHCIHRTYCTQLVRSAGNLVHHRVFQDSKLNVQGATLCIEPWWDRAVAHPSRVRRDEVVDQVSHNCFVNSKHIRDGQLGQVSDGGITRQHCSEGITIHIPPPTNVLGPASASHGKNGWQRWSAGRYSGQLQHSHLWWVWHPTILHTNALNRPHARSSRTTQ